MQYRKGSVTVTNGSAVVIGVGTAWSGKFAPGALFAIPNTIGTYYIQSVDSDTSITLTTPWGGDDVTGVQYWVTADFTPILGLPTPQPNDLEAVRVIEKALTMLDSLVQPTPFGLFAVKSATTVNPPGSPSDGDAYIVPKTGATGAWASYGAKIVIFRRGAWLVYAPSGGQLLLSTGDSAYYVYSSGSATWTVNSALTSGGTLAAREATPTDGAYTFWDAANSRLSTAGAYTKTSLAAAITALNTGKLDTTTIGTTVQAHAARLDTFVSTGLDTTMFKTGTFDIDGTLAANSATRVPAQSAVKTYVDAKVAALVASSPAALDTLNELAAALGNDANFATTTSTALGNRLRVDAAQTLTTGQQAQAFTNLGVSIDTDGTLAANSDSHLVTQKAIKTFVAASVNAAAVANNSITYAKMQQANAATLLGNATGALANMAEITLGAGLAFSGSALQLAAFTGDVTAPANSNVMTVAKVGGQNVGGAAGSGKVVFDTNPVIATPVLTGLTKIDTFSEGVGAAINATTSTTVIDVSANAVLDVTLKADTALSFTGIPTDVGYQHSFLLYVRQDLTGNRTPSWDSSIKWPNGTPPASTKTAQHYDVFQFIAMGGVVIGGLIYGNIAP